MLQYKYLYLHSTHVRNIYGDVAMPARTALDRYSRQTLFRPIGKEGQERLRTASVAIIGCGALGSSLANNLCRAGIGRLVIADRDYILWGDDEYSPWRYTLPALHFSRNARAGYNRDL